MHGVPRTIGQLDGHTEGIATLLGRILIPEVVEHLLEAHGVNGWQPTVSQDAAHVGVARRVHVHGKGAARIGLGGDEPTQVQLRIHLSACPIERPPVLTRSATTQIAQAATVLAPHRAWTTRTSRSATPPTANTDDAVEILTVEW